MTDSILKKRKKYLKFRCFKSEKQAIEQQAKGMGYSQTAEFMRETLLNVTLGENTDREEALHIKNFVQADPKIILAIARIGNNLNQISRHANSKCELDNTVLVSIEKIRQSMSQIVEQNKDNANVQFKLEQQVERVEKCKRKTKDCNAENTVEEIVYKNVEKEPC